MNGPALPRPPMAAAEPHLTTHFGDTRYDEFHWLRHRADPRVMQYLTEENQYLENVMEAEAALREQLVHEMRSRLQPIDQSVPYQLGDYLYYWSLDAEKQYRIHYRKHLTTQQIEMLLDENEWAEGHSYFSLGAFEVSPCQNFLAYSIDTSGAETFGIYIKNLKTGRVENTGVTNCYYSLAWSPDSSEIFFNVLDDKLRPNSIFSLNVTYSKSEKTLIYHESDPTMFVWCWTSRDKQMVFICSAGAITTEYRYLKSSGEKDALPVILPRKHGVQYHAHHHHGQFFVLINDIEKNFRMIEIPMGKDGPIIEWHRGDHDRYLKQLLVFKDFFVLHESQKGLPQFRIIHWEDHLEHLIEFEEPTYTLIAAKNPEFNTEHFKFIFSSLITPRTVFEYNMLSRQKTVLKTQNVHGYNFEQYQTERLAFKSHDGEEIPVSILYSKAARSNGPLPLYLYGYGAYGTVSDPIFDANIFSLVDRGFAFAIAHVRGGGDLGRLWYEDGKFLNKKNTFEDMIAVTHGLIGAGYTAKGEVVLSGESAGGLMVGAVLNMGPHLYRAGVALVPFVDVLNTMFDDTLPLTPIEYDEWGDPRHKEYYKYIASYSPYDNIKPQEYPHIFITAGLNDPRVTYWEPAKWCARLRTMNQSNSLIVLHTQMGAGHFGSSGRFDFLKDKALEYAFILKVFKKP